MGEQGKPQPARPNPVVAAVGRARETLSTIFRERKPWAELADRTAFAKPGNFAEATGRLKKNAAYFRVNYLIFVAMVTAVCFGFHPTSLIVVAFLGMAWVYLFLVRQAPLVLAGRTFSTREKFLGVSAVSVIVIFFLTSVGTVLFLALGISVAGVALHGAFRVPDDLFTDEAESQQSMFGFLTAPTNSSGGPNMV